MKEILSICSLVYSFIQYRMSKNDDAFHIQISREFILLQFVCSHVYSKHEVVNDCNSTVLFKFLQLKCILTPTWG